MIIQKSKDPEAQQFSHLPPSPFPPPAHPAHAPPSSRLGAHSNAAESSAATRSNLDLVSSPRLPSTHELRLRWILWISLVVAVLSFAMSMVHLGLTSFWVAMAGVGSTIILDVTLLLFNAREIHDLEFGSDNDHPQPLHTSSQDKTALRTPCTASIGAIGASCFLILVWGGALVMQLYMMVYYSSWYGGSDRSGRALALVFEVVFAVTQLELLFTYVVIAVKERRRIRRDLGKGH